MLRDERGAILDEIPVVSSGIFEFEAMHIKF